MSVTHRPREKIPLALPAPAAPPWLPIRRRGFVIDPETGKTRAVSVQLDRESLPPAGEWLSLVLPEAGLAVRVKLEA